MNSPIPPSIGDGQKLAGIQALRGISVLMTVLAHLPLATLPFVSAGMPAPWLIGVAVFYGISGWIIAHVTERDDRVLPFLVKRWFRLVPIMAVSLAIMLVAAELLAHSPVVDQFYPPIKQANWSAWANLLFVSDVSGPQPVPISVMGLWSISVEAKFYIVYAAVLLLPRKSQYKIATLATLLVVAIAGRWYLALHGSLYAHAHAWYIELFICGAISNRYRHLFKNRLPLLIAASAWVFVFPVLSLNGSAWMLAYLGLVAAIIYIVNCAASASMRLPAIDRPLVWLGERSYVLYVMHFQFIAIGGLIGQVAGSVFASVAGYNSILIASLVLGLPLVNLLHRTVERWGILTAKNLTESNFEHKASVVRQLGY